MINKNMNKNRIETLSDGVFAIIMTILVLEFKIPKLPPQALESSATLFSELIKMSPVFFSYSTSFAILAMYWIGHHNLFHLFTKNINRTLMEINVLFLMLVSLLPFLSHLLGEYRYNQGAVQVYAVGTVLIGLCMYSMYDYAEKSKEIDNHEVDNVVLKKITIRIWLPIISACVSFFISFWSLNLSFIFLFAPVIFNIIPGSLNFLESKLTK
jgi:uncharacterized membrane protein